MWVHTIYSPTFFDIRDPSMLLGYRITSGLKILCIGKTSHPGEEGEYFTGA